MMIDILLKSKNIIKAENINEIPSELDFFIMHFLDYCESDLKYLTEQYNLDFSIMKNYEDIEISSHFLEDDNQAAFHFSIPYYDTNRKLIEEPYFIIISEVGLFLFSSSSMDKYINDIYPNKAALLHKATDVRSLFNFQFAFISDYYADITENLSRKIKLLANSILIEKDISSHEMDIITRFNFNNLLIKELLIETTRVFRLYIKSNWEQKMDIRSEVKDELNDLTVVSDYIQFNFDRLDDLRENVSNKIDLEQNHIFKTLTVVTVCISLPTFIAGVYGMNFNNMPETNSAYGYPIILVIMILSAMLPFLYFKKKKWL